MKSTSFIKVFLLFFLILSNIACIKNAVTGRKQLNLVTNQSLMSMASQEYATFLQANKVVTQTKDALLVKQIGSKIAASITQYYQSLGQSSILAGYQWEYNLIESKEANAWCMPGGKIVVFTGLLPITKNEAALAAVMGHEVAHALAQHGAERASAQMIQQFGAIGLDAALSSKPNETKAIFQQAFGIGSNVLGVLPFSRKHELEADKLGLFYAAKAGYDPRESIALWQRMEAMGGNQRPPEFLSTHPAEQTRIEQLKQLMPQALEFFKEAGGKL